VSSRARAAAIEAARRRKKRKQLTAVLTIGVLLAALVGGAVLATNGTGTTKPLAASGSSSEPATPSTPPTTALPSVAGQPCVPLADPLPAGAPDVPIVPGPPPATLQTTDIKVGTGADVTTTDSLTVNYIGVSCSSGKIFDSSYSRGQPVTFSLTGVIKGWQDGIPGMKVGGERLLVIPPGDGYGDTGAGTTIAPGETLWFVVDIVDAKPADPSAST
jgi:peptidylprolyl isomerase